MSNTKVIWLIEDNENEADNYRRFLQRAIKAGSSDLSVNIINVKDKPSLADYRDIVTNQDTGAVLIDYDLKRGGVEYDGADLARYLRMIKPELSMYILTAWRQDVEGLGEVEDVIPKEEMRKSASGYLQAILRSMKRYETALTEKQKRLNALVDVKLAGTIGKKEEAELLKLRQEIERPFADVIIAAEIKSPRTENEELKALERISEQLERITTRSRKLPAKKTPTRSKKRKS
ncbi:MAG: hypothetical protein HY872_09335 [Chloroflexi bacterium]|nr:hypothetical protein [Chloroflexota bacterium]